MKRSMLARFPSHSSPHERRRHPASQTDRQTDVCHDEVLHDATAIAVHPTEVKLRTGMALLGGKAIPADGFLVVFGNAFIIGEILKRIGATAFE